MPKYKKGHSGNPGGRPKGTPNKETKILRERLADLLDANYDKFIEAVEKQKDKDLIKTFTDLLEYCTPKLNRTDLSSNKPINITLGNKEEKL